MVRSWEEKVEGVVMEGGRRIWKEEGFKDRRGAERFKDRRGGEQRRDLKMGREGNRGVIQG